MQFPIENRNEEQQPQKQQAQIIEDDSVLIKKEQNESLSTIPSSSDLRTTSQQQIEDPMLSDGGSSHQAPEYYRYVQLVAYVIMSILTGASFMNWKPLYELLSRANAYADICELTAHDNHSNPILVSSSYELRPDGEIYCDGKDYSISSMLPIAAGVMYSGDIVAGVLLDKLGSKMVSSFGLVAQISGWTLIAIASSVHSHRGYMPGLILVALGVDSTCYGLLSVANLFPQHGSTIISILSAARSVSHANILVLQWTMNGNIDLNTVAFIFVGILSFWLVFTLACVPWCPFPKTDAKPTVTGVGSKRTATATESNRAGGQWKLRLPSLYKKLSPSSRFILPSHRFQVAPHSHHLRHQHERLSPSSWHAFLEHAVTPSYIALCLLVVLTFIRNIWFTVTYKQHLSHRAAEIYAILNPVTVVSSPLLAILAERIGTSLMILFQSICGTVGMLLLVVAAVLPTSVHSTAAVLQYLAVMFNFIFITFSTSQFYMYVAYCYPQPLMGRLLGFAIFLGGLCSFAVSWLYGSVLDHLIYVDVAVMISGVVASALCVYLYLSFERPIRQKIATTEES